VMKQKIYIHIGMPKTGTSAIQNFLVNNIALLDSCNLYYPSHTMDINGISSGNGAYLIHLLNNNQFDEAKKLLDNFLTNANGKNILLSSENFYRYPEKIKQLIPNAIIIVYIREQSEQIRADYNQSVKRHRQIYFFDKALESALRRKDMFFDFGLLDIWEKCYGKENLIVKIYDKKEFLQSNIIYDFLYIFECSSDVVDYTDKKINISYIEDALRFKIWFNKLISKIDDPEIEIVDKNIDYILQKYSQELYDKGLYVKYNYSTFYLDKIEKFYKHSNEQIRLKYFPNRDKLFDTKICFAKKYQGLSKDKVLDIGFYIKKENNQLFQKVCFYIRLLEKNSKTDNNIVSKLKPLLGI